MIKKGEKTNHKINPAKLLIMICFCLTVVLLAFLFTPKKALAYTFTASFSNGNETNIELPFDYIHSIQEIDLGGDGTSELVAGSPPGFEGKVYLIRQDGSIINSWYAYDKNFTGGVLVETGDFDEDGIPEIVTAPESGGGPHIRIFNGFGKPVITPGFFADKQNYRGKIGLKIQKFSDKKPMKIAATLKNHTKTTLKIFSSNGTLFREYQIQKRKQKQNNETLKIPVMKNGELLFMSIPAKTRAITSNEKTVIIDLSDQTLSYYKSGFRLNTFPVSTGMRGYDTPAGDFSILNKIDLAYSKTYGLYMPFWMSFTNRGHGIHELPYWPSGYREGENHLGTPVSHGCVRLGAGVAQKLYEWAEVGTKVLVQN